VISKLDDPSVYNLNYSALPPTCSQARADISTKPVPLQLFWPLQALLADLQLVLPLQAFNFFSGSFCLGRSCCYDNQLILTAHEKNWGRSFDLPQLINTSNQWLIS
jgi:hypothetical protein